MPGEFNRVLSGTVSWKSGACNLFSRNRSSLPSSSFVGRKNCHERHTLCNTPFQRRRHILKRLFLDLRFWKHPMFCLVYCSVLVLKCCFFVILAKNSFIHSWYYFSSYLFSDRHRPPRVKWYWYCHSFSTERHQPARKTTDGLGAGT